MAHRKARCAGLIAEQLAASVRDVRDSDARSASPHTVAPDAPAQQPVATHDGTPRGTLPPVVTEDPSADRRIWRLLVGGAWNGWRYPCEEGTTRLWIARHRKETILAESKDERDQLRAPEGSVLLGYYEVLAPGQPMQWTPVPLLASRSAPA